MLEYFENRGYIYFKQLGQNSFNRGFYNFFLSYIDVKGRLYEGWNFRSIGLHLLL